MPKRKKNSVSQPINKNLNITSSESSSESDQCSLFNEIVSKSKSHNVSLPLINDTLTSPLNYSNVQSLIQNEPSTSSGTYHSNLNLMQNEPSTSSGIYQSNLNLMQDEPSTSTGIYHSDLNFIQDESLITSETYHSNLNSVVQKKLSTSSEVFNSTLNYAKYNSLYMELLTISTLREKTGKKITVYVPDERIRNIGVNGSYKVNVNKLKEFIESKKDVGLSLCASIKELNKIHVMFDIDYVGNIEANCNIQMGRLIIEKLNTTMPNCNWQFSIRKENVGGIHIFLTNYFVFYKDYEKSAVEISNILGLDNNFWKMDTKISNFTLPSCGKFCGKDYIYKTLDGNYDPFPLCLESDCIMLEILSEIRDYVCHIKTKKGKADDFIETFCSTICPTNVCINEDNALIYYFKYFYENIDVTINPLLLAAKNIVNNYGIILRTNDVKYFICSNVLCYPNNKEIKLFNMIGRDIMIHSDVINALVSSIKENCWITLTVLLSLQFPLWEKNNKIFIFNNGEWKEVSVNEIIMVLDLVLNNVKDCIKKKTIKCSKNDLKNNIVTFWNVNERSKMLEGKISSFICTQDNYIYEFIEQQFIRSSIILPFTQKTSLFFKKCDLESITITSSDIYDLFSHINKIYIGETSFLKYYKSFINTNTPLTEDPIFMIFYFITTFFSFDTIVIKYFFKLMRKILLGESKNIIYIVGETADNGKTTLMKILNSCFGGSSMIFSIVELSGNKNTLPTHPDIYKIGQKKLLLVDEAGSSQLNCNTVKQITSDGIVSVRSLYTDTTEVKCSANIIFFGNSKPNITLDEGVRKRLKLFNAEAVFYDQILSRLIDPFTLEVNWTDKIVTFPKIKLDINILSLGLLFILLKVKQFDDIDQPSSVTEISISDYINAIVEEDSNSFILESQLEYYIASYCKKRNISEFIQHEILSTIHKKYVNNFDIFKRQFNNLKLVNEI